MPELTDSHWVKDSLAWLNWSVIEAPSLFNPRIESSDFLNPLTISLNCILVICEFKLRRLIIYSSFAERTALVAFEFFWFHASISFAFDNRCWVDISKLYSERVLRKSFCVSFNTACNLSNWDVIAELFAPLFIIAFNSVNSVFTPFILALTSLADKPSLVKLSLSVLIWVVISPLSVIKNWILSIWAFSFRVLIASAVWLTAFFVLSKCWTILSDPLISPLKTNASFSSFNAMMNDFVSFKSPFTCSILTLNFSRTPSLKISLVIFTCPNSANVFLTSSRIYL